VTMKKSYLFSVVSIFLILVFSPLFSLPMSAQEDNRILFTSEQDGNREIYLMNAEGSDLQRLTNDPAEDTEPAWSPDRSQVAFVSNRDGDTAIYVMNIDGSDVRRITPTNLGTTNTSPNWSPDGERLAFVTDTYGSPEIYTVEIDGTDARRLTNNSSDDLDPIWSPDGRHIVFSSNESGDFALYIMNADGSDIRQLTNDPNTDDDSPAWSPDGTQIAFATNGRSSEINIMDTNGANERLLTSTNDGFISSLAWSPASESLAYMVSNGAQSSIRVINTDGLSARQLTLSSIPAGYPAWAAPVPLEQSETGQLAGEWTGLLYQGSNRVFAFSMTLTQDGDQFQGTSRISYIENDSSFAVMEITGELDNGTFNFEEGERLEGGTTWCIKQGNLTYLMDVNIAHLVGDWNAPGCTPGRLELYHTSENLFLNIEGEWTGTLSQGPGGSASSYQYTMSIRQNGSHVSGTTHIMRTDDDRYFGTMSFDGTFQNGVLTFEESDIVEQAQLANANWCIKRGILILTSENETDQLAGPWDDSDCPSGGNIVVTRSALE
jgi:Tol biopolymer transport system component